MTDVAHNIYKRVKHPFPYNVQTQYSIYSDVCYRSRMKKKINKAINSEQSWSDLFLMIIIINPHLLFYLRVQGK